MPLHNTGSKAGDPSQQAEFPSVEPHEPTTRRQQFAAKDSLRGDARGRGSGRGRGKGAAAMKSKAKKKSGDHDDDDEHEGLDSSASAGPVERGSDLARAKRHISETAVDGLDLDDAEQPAKKSKSGDDEDTNDSAAKPTRKSPKAKPAAKKKANAKAKAKATAKSKAAAKSATEKKATAAAKAKPQGKPKGKAKATPKKKPGHGLTGDKLTQAIAETSKRLKAMSAPEPLVFKSVRPDSMLPNPDNVRETLLYECLNCLTECHAANEADKKGKHNHLGKMDQSGTLRFEIYWSRASVGVKRLIDNEMKQVVYFSRPTVCIGTNQVLAKYWALSLQVHNTYSVSLRNTCPSVRLISCSPFVFGRYAVLMRLPKPKAALYKALPPGAALDCKVMCHYKALAATVHSEALRGLIA